MSQDLENLVRDFNSLKSLKTGENSNIELEIIITNGKSSGVTAGQYKTIMDTLTNKNAVVNTQYMVDKIHSNVANAGVKNNTFRLTMNYIKKPDGAGYSLKNTVKMNKKRFPPYEDAYYKVVLATEEILKQDSQSASNINNTNDLCRIKVRNTFTNIQSLEKWKVDVTAVFGIKWNSNAQQMNTIIRSTFDADKNLSKFNSFEVEAEYTGNENMTIDEINRVASIIGEWVKNNNSNDSIIYKEANELAEVVGRYKAPKLTIKRIMVNPVELNKDLYKDIFPPIGYYVTDKADGKRSVIFVRNNKLSILNDKLITKGLDNVPDITIVDTELINDIYYIFDVLYFQGTSYIKIPFQRRVTILDEAAEYLTKITGYKIVAKPFIRLPLLLSDSLESELKKPIMTMFERKRDYEIDGLIINSADAGYFDTKMYKWKPENTIDFLAVKCPDIILGKHPYVNIPNKILYLLFTTMSINDYELLGIKVMDNYHQVLPQFSNKYGPVANANGSFPMQFSPASYNKAYLWYTDEDKYNMKIVELSVDDKFSKSLSKGLNVPWKLIKIRDDRQLDVDAGSYFGNAYHVADSVWQNVINPFPIESLWTPNNVYFQEDKDPVYNAPTAMNSFIKSLLFKKIKPDIIYRQHESKDSVTLLDIGAGRGADIKRYAEAEFNQVVAIDNDITALSELSRRRYSLMKAIKNMPMINTLEVNMNDNFQAIINHMELLGVPTKYDAISCNFAVHYMPLTNVAKLIGKLLKPLGRFGFTVLDGARVNALISNISHGESWKRVLDNGFVKYEIKKMYVGNVLSNGGQFISVKVPFSQNLYTEALVNIDYFLKLLAAEGMNVKMRKHFSDFRAEFAAENPEKEKKLEEMDMEYNGLYEFIIVEKKVK